MTTSLGTTPTARVFEVEDLVAMVREGQVRIPEFQRPFRWGLEDARQLFDSMMRGYPLGSLLLWARPAEAASISVGALQIDAPAMENALWVVDGQQRVTALANALSPESGSDERFGLSLDLTTRRIVPNNNDKSFSIPLPTLFDLSQLLTWFRDTPEAESYFDSATEAAKKIRQFKLPASVVETKDESVLRDIFDRLNNYGKRLTRAEVFTALHPVTDGGGRPTSTAIEDIAGHISTDLEFGSIDSSTILQAVLARRAPDIRREIRTEFDNLGKGEFPGEDAEAAYHATQQALDRAIEFLRNDAATPHFAFLPYRHLLVVLTRFFGHHPEPTPRQTQLLRRWYWRAAAAGTSLFPGGNSGTLRTLCTLVTPTSLDATLSGLLEAVPESKISWPSVRHFRTNHASGKIIACAMWARRPRSLRNGDTLDRSDLMDAVGEAQTPRPALTPIVSRRAALAAKADSAARWLLVPGLEAAPAEVPAILTNPPIDISENTWVEILRSHVVDPDTAAELAEGNAKHFVARRENELADIVHTFMTQQMEYGYEDTPVLESLVLDDLEEEPDEIDVDWRDDD